MVKIDINIKIPGEKLAIKIWQSLIDNGAGGVLKPWQIKREGRAFSDVKVERMLMIAQAEQDLRDIREGKKKTGAKCSGQI